MSNEGYTGSTEPRPLKVLVSGWKGNMGQETVRAVLDADGMCVAGGYDPKATQTEITLGGQHVAPAFIELDQAISAVQPDVLVDFSLPVAAPENIKTALEHRVDCVVGTSGLDHATLERLGTYAKNETALFVAPNFSIGAVVMMMAAAQAAKYFPDVEVLEFHHNAKADAPSATAIATARTIARLRAEQDLATAAPGPEAELIDFAGSRGAALGDVRLHSIRSDGFVAAQEVIFGSPGQTLTIRHDSINRSAFMPGVLLAIRKVGQLRGLIIGLEELMNL